MPAGVLLAIPDWGLMAIGAGLFVVVAVLLAVGLRRKPAAAEADATIAWGDPHGELPPEPPAPAPTFEPAPPVGPAPASWPAPEFEAAGPPPAPAGPVHHCRCPACQTQFTVNGPRPIVTNCPGCGRKGFLR